MTLFPVLLAVAAISHLPPFQSPPTQDPPSPLIFRYTATTKQVPSYIFHVLPDGSGNFAESVASPDGTVHDTTASLHLSARSTEALFAQISTVQNTGFPCASKAKNIANTGVKVLETSAGSCTYNFSENKTVVALTGAFQSMALTLDEGRKLAFILRYDRLGLNDEMTILWNAVKDGRATEMGNIADILTKLANREDILESVRQRAASLLKMAE